MITDNVRKHWSTGLRVLMGTRSRLMDENSPVPPEIRRLCRHAATNLDRASACAAAYSAEAAYNAAKRLADATRKDMAVYELQEYSSSGLIRTQYGVYIRDQVPIFPPNIKATIMAVFT